MIKVIEQGKNIDILKMLNDTGSILKGHFRLSSGYHSEYYLQCAKLLQYPDLTLKIAEEAKNILNKDIETDNIDYIISPAIGGIIFGYMLAFNFGKKMIFTERKNKEMELRRGFKLKPGQKIIIAEDVVTTGGSVYEVINICKKNNAEIKAIISIVDRSIDIKFEFPYYYLIKLNIEKYNLSNCPLCKRNLKLIYPGSKKNH